MALDAVRGRPISGVSLNPARSFGLALFGACLGVVINQELRWPAIKVVTASKEI